MMRLPSSTVHRVLTASSTRTKQQVQHAWRPLNKAPSNSSGGGGGGGGGGRRNASSSNNNSGTTSTGNKNTNGNTAAGEAEVARQQILHDANEQMKNYHNARIAKLRGELPSKRKTSQGVNKVQAGIVVAFLAAFAASPFMGKKIATDKEFREKYIPSWYDFTIKRPTSELSREEVHEQILQLQKEIRARAIRGEFSDEKISKMRRYMDGLDPDKEFSPDNDEHAWSKLHPGVADDEEVEDE